METMAKRLQIALDAKNKKQIDLAHDLDIPRSAISQYISGRSKTMPSDRIYLIADYLDVSIPWLMGFGDEMLSKDEEELLDIFRSLSDTDKTSFLNYARFLGGQ